MQWQRLPHFVYVCVKDLYRCVSQRERERDYFHRLGHCGTDTARHVKHEHCSRNSIRDRNRTTTAEQQSKAAATTTTTSTSTSTTPRAFTSTTTMASRIFSDAVASVHKNALGYGQVDQNISEPENGSKKCCILCAQQLQYIMYKR